MVRAPILAEDVEDYEDSQDLDLDDEPIELSAAAFANLFSGPPGRAATVSVGSSKPVGSVRMLTHASALPGADMLVTREFDVPSPPSPPSPPSDSNMPSPPPQLSSPPPQLSPAASVRASAPGSAPQLPTADLLLDAALKEHGWSSRHRSDPYPLEGGHGTPPDHFTTTFAEEAPRPSSRSRSPSPLSSLCAMPS